MSVMYELEPELNAEMYRRELRRVLKTALAKELNGPLPPAPPPCELHEAVRDFCDLRDDTTAFGLPFPDAKTSAEPEAVAAHLLKRAWALAHEIGSNLDTDFDVDAYDFENEHNEIVADSIRRSRSISRVQIHNGFRDVTHHAFIRAALKRVAT